MIAIAMNFRILLASIVVLGLFGCESFSNDPNVEDDPAEPGDNETYFPDNGTDFWETVSPDEIGWHSAALTDLYAFLENSDTKAFLVLNDGRIAIEQYFNGWTSTDDHPWYSAGKTITAFMMGIAEEEDFLKLNDPSYLYLGSGWSSMTPEQEANVTVRNHITMTTGLDFTNPIFNFCTLPGCLNYLNEPGTVWYYHNAPYTLSQPIIDGAVGQFFEAYFNAKLKDRIGMNGFWQAENFNKIYYSSARSMARFGHLILNEGKWKNTSLLSNADNYFQSMTSTSQSMNRAYGYLWWLNGQSTYRIPGSTDEYFGELIPNAPSDLIAGLGFNDQKLYVIPSMDLVVIRMGGDGGEAQLGPSGYDNALWEKLNQVIQ